MIFGNEIGNLKGLFYDGVVIDDVVFKLHYGFTSYLLLFMTFLSVSKVFFNEPIYCSMGAYEYEKIISKEMLNNYCYIHSTFIVPNSAQYLDDSLYAYQGVGPYSLGDQGSVVFHSYYQWISLLLFIQGLLYYVSHLWWAQMESGTMKALKLELDNPALNIDEQDKQLTKLKDYFIKYRGRHHMYGLQYFYVVIFNSLHVMLDIIITHFILNRSFLYYGWDFTFSTNANRYILQDQVFPKMSKCNIHLFGPSGTRQTYDSICVLPLNILYDKLFLVLWYWYFLLFLLSFISVLYWAFHIISPNCRLKHIEKKLKGKVKGNQLKFLNKHFGDWFILNQLHKNIHHSNFTQLVSSLCSAGEEGKTSILKKAETFISFNLNDETDEEVQRVLKNNCSHDAGLNGDNCPNSTRAERLL